MGDYEARTPVFVESLLGYHPCSIGFLTNRRNPAGGQRQVGSLTGAVASKRGTEALKGSLSMDGNHAKECKGIRGPDCERDISSRDESRA